MEIKLQPGLTLDPKNLQVFLDIESDIAVKKDGFLNVSLKCSYGYVVDYVWYENSNDKTIPVNNKREAVPINNLPFYIMIDRHIKRLMFGQITYTGVIKNGIVNISKVNYTYAKRRRYSKVSAKNI